MSILYFISYLSEIDYSPTSMVELANLIAPTDKKGTGKILLTTYANDLLNISVKLGFVWQARDLIGQIDSNINPNISLANFYLSNFIYDTKAFLDAIAVCLNDFYKLGFKGRHIDLKEITFINKLDSKSTIVQHLKKDMKWIQDVVDWRNKTIHQFSIFVANYSTMHDTRNTNKTIGSSTIRLRMPVEPIPFFEMSKFIHYGGKSINVISFVDDWLNHSKELFEITCDSLVQNIKSRNENIID